MKTTVLSIEHMDQAREALNNALQLAMRLMQEKAAGEATVSMSISMEMRPDGGYASWIPVIRYKTGVKVPVEIKNVGQATNASQVYWDQDEMTYMMIIEGEQVRINE